MKIRRSFIEFSQRLRQAAQAVADGLTHRTDHYTFDGGMNEVEDLLELLDQAKTVEDLATIFYAEDRA